MFAVVPLPLLFAFWVGCPLLFCCPNTAEAQKKNSTSIIPVKTTRSNLFITSPITCPAGRSCLPVSCRSLSAYPPSLGQRHNFFIRHRSNLVTLPFFLLLAAKLASALADFISLQCI